MKKMTTDRISGSFEKEVFPNGRAHDTRAHATWAEARHAEAHSADDDNGQNKKVLDYLRHMEQRTIQIVGERGVLGQWLTTLVPAPQVDYLLALYHVGALPDGRTVFPYVTRAGYTVDGKVMAYGEDGHRVKASPQPSPDNGEVGGGVKTIEGGGFVSWLHALDRLERPLPLPLFGEHLADSLPFAPLCLVESEKTVLVAKLWRPDCTWLATGGKSMFTADRCRVLAGRTVFVWPDADAISEWMETAATLGQQLDIRFQFPTAYLTRIREGPSKGDLADLIQKQFM